MGAQGTVREISSVVKPEWGTKRICHNCGARFYDLHRDPIVCPRCATVFDPEALLRSRRSRSAIVAELAAEKPAKAKAAPVADETALSETEELEAETASAEAAEGASEEIEEVESSDEEFDEEESDDSNVLLEDASELGDDNVDDVIDVDGSDEDAR